MRDEGPFEFSYFLESWRGTSCTLGSQGSDQVQHCSPFVQEEQASSLSNQIIILSLLSEVKQDLRNSFSR